MSSSNESALESKTTDYYPTANYGIVTVIVIINAVTVDRILVPKLASE